uniref:Uncharacterized protein n=1 Tax=Timema cristinae TaxID=61476 RepID=A0A7R9H690_TIMCR|nr:unnamed protein product [Timema cristinae]
MVINSKTLALDIDQGGKAALSSLRKLYVSVSDSYGWIMVPLGAVLFMVLSWGIIYNDRRSARCVSTKSVQFTRQIVKESNRPGAVLELELHNASFCWSHHLDYLDLRLTSLQN